MARALAEAEAKRWRGKYERLRAAVAQAQSLFEDAEAGEPTPRPSSRGETPLRERGFTLALPGPGPSTMVSLECGGGDGNLSDGSETRGLHPRPQSLHSQAPTRRRPPRELRACAHRNAFVHFQLLGMATAARPPGPTRPQSRCVTPSKFCHHQRKSTNLSRRRRQERARRRRRTSTRRRRGTGNPVGGDAQARAMGTISRTRTSPHHLGMALRLSRPRGDEGATRRHSGGPNSRAPFFRQRHRA